MTEGTATLMRDASAASIYPGVAVPVVLAVSLAIAGPFHPDTAWASDPRLRGPSPPSNLRPAAALHVRLLPPGMVTNPDTILRVPDIARPPYLTPQPEPTFGGQLRRVTGDAGTAFP